MELRRLRRESGRTVEDVHQELEISQPKLSRIESGRQEIPQRDLIALLTIYGAPERIRELTELRRVAREPGWFQEYGVENGTYVDFESGASAVKSFDPLLIPGLLQIEPYAREVIRAHTFDTDDVEGYVNMRLERRKLLDADHAPKVWSVIGEAAVRTVVKSRDVMARQLEHLLTLSQHPRVTIQLLPFDSGAHPAMDGGFSILEFSDAEDMTLVYVDRATGSTWAERPGEVERATMTFGHMLASASSPDESARAIQKIMMELRE
jgi:transcriptional regulator with XRE-family HTH domain